MRIAFYAPFKPLGHSTPSGDLAIATGLHDYLAARGHEVRCASRLRTRWIYWRPWAWPRAAGELVASRRAARRLDAQVWLTYHAYYKAPDILGPLNARALSIPYVVFQGIYSTSRRRDVATWPGYALNRRGLLSADHVFTNKLEDLRNLRRLLPERRLTYVRPGIRPGDFAFDPGARREKRAAWGVPAGRPVVLTAGMFRPNYKTESIVRAIETLGRLAEEGEEFLFVLAGDGEERARVLDLGRRLLGERMIYAGLVARSLMPRLYSAADLFVFPGVNESLGMVFLEAQSCGLPAVAYADSGVPEVVADGLTGLLAPPFDEAAFRGNIRGLLRDADRRRSMGLAAAAHVREHHDQDRNYGLVEEILAEVVARKNSEES